MRIYYDITLEDKKKNRKVMYWADSFSINEERILKVRSQECGDIVVKIEINEQIIVKEVRVYDDWE